MKNGFTLIELLAVIVVLAIIALIAVPVVLNIINEAKESSLLRSAEFYLDAVEYTIADAFLYHGGLSNGEYSITPEGNICKKALPCDDNNTLKVEVSGDKPTGGFITIDGGNISRAELVLNERTIAKNSKGELVYLKYLDEVCKLVSGTEKTAGAKYSCKVDPNKESYTFYVLTTPSATDTSINLIMDRNICSDGTAATSDNTCLVAWISKEDYNDDENFGEYGNNNKGPITAMTYLNNATSTWENIDNLNITYDDEGENFTDFALNGKARLPYLSEVNNYSESKGFLYENLDGDYWEYDESIKPTNNISGICGYWTLSSTAYNSSGAWRVYCGGYVEGYAVNYDTHYGVRPVITLKF